MAIQPYEDLINNLDLHVAAFLEWMVNGGMKRSTAEQYAGVVRAMLRQGDIRNSTKFDIIADSYKSSTRNLRVTARRKYMTWVADGNLIKGRAPTVERDKEKIMRMTHARILSSVQDRLNKIMEDYNVILNAGFVTTDFVDFVNEYVVEKELRDLKYGSSKIATTDVADIPFTEDTIDEVELESESESESEPEPGKPESDDLDAILEELTKLNSALE